MVEWGNAAKPVAPADWGSLAKPVNDMDYQSREKPATLPEPHDYMFAGMDDADAATYFHAYGNHPDSTVQDDGTIFYKGKQVPKPEGNSGLVQAITNPTGKLGATLAGDEEAVPQGMEKYTTPILGGALNMAKAATELGAAGVDKLKNFNSSVANYLNPDVPVTTDASSAQYVKENFPEYNAEGMGQHAGEFVGNMGTGLVLGNKIAALTKMTAMAPAAAESLMKLAAWMPKWTAKLAANLATRLPMQAAGVGVAMPTGSDTLTTGNNAMIPILSGLETKGPDEAQNIINDRINIAADALFTSLPIEGIGLGTKAIWNQFVSGRVINPLKVLFSSEKRNQVLAEDVMTRLGHVTGHETQEQKDAIRDQLVTLFRDKNKQFMDSGDMGIPGVDNQKFKLDPTTMVQRETAGSKAPYDVHLGEGMRQERNRVINEGGARTEFASEQPERALKDVLNQTEAAFGKGDSVEKAREATQGIAKNEADTAAALSKKEQDTILDTTKEMTHNVNIAEGSRTYQMDQLYDKISETVPADMESFTKVVEDAGDALPSNLKKIIEKSNGTFRYLNNVLKPKLNKEISRLSSKGEDTSALQAIRNNIESDQLDFIINQRGQLPGWTPNDAKFAEEAKAYARDVVMPNRQGPVGQLRDISRKDAGQLDEIYTKSRDVLRKTIDAIDEQPEYNKRLKDVLASVEGNKSEALIEKYRKANDRKTALDEIEREIYDDKFKHFYSPVTRGKPLPNGIESFKQLLKDPQGGETVDELLKHPEIQAGMKSVWSKMADETFFPTVTSRTSGSPKFSMSNVDRSNFMKYGEKIFKDKPEVFKFVKDLSDVALDVGKAKSIKAAPAGATTQAEGLARQAGQAVITMKEGRLTRKAAIESALLQMTVKIINVTPVLKHIKDKAMADPDKMADLLSHWRSAEQIKPGSFARDLSRWMAQEGINTDGSTNEFEDKVKNKLGNTKKQTDELLNQKRTVVNDVKDYGKDVLKTGAGYVNQTIDALKNR